MTYFYYYEIITFVQYYYYYINLSYHLITYQTLAA